MSRRKQRQVDVHAALYRRRWQRRWLMHPAAEARRDRLWARRGWLVVTYEQGVSDAD